MSFDDIIDRRGTHCSKWDKMEAIYGVPADTGIAMWVADMDFRPPQVVQDALQAQIDHGVHGYFGDDSEYLAAIQWWMENRHGWKVDADAIFTNHGLVNGTAMCVDAFTQPGDGVVLFTPVYHAFARVIRASRRELVEFPLALREDLYRMDWDNWDSLLTGREKVLILCSPHNPGGRVWSYEELRQVADFCIRHDLILISDDIHCDLTMPGQTHSMIAKVAPELRDRLITLTAATKTFNIAGAHIGNAIIADDTLREGVRRALLARGVSAAFMGADMVAAAYSPEGAAWVDALTEYLDGNRRLFDEGVNAIPGLRSMPLEATYLSWVDFSGTGMTPEDFTARVEKIARIAANHGHTFGKGGDSFLRFNIATPRARVAEAVSRLQDAFADLQ